MEELETATDKRVKGCPNESCECRLKKIKYKATVDHCPKCGSRLIYVCPKCFSEIEDIDSSHRICKLCEAKNQETKDKAVGFAKNAAKKVGAGALAIGVAVGSGIAHNVGKDIKKDVIKHGTEIVKNIINNVAKK